MKIFNFFKKKKDINEDTLKEKIFLKDNIIYNKLEKRTDSFYREKYKKYTTISLFFAIGTFFVSTFGHQMILNKNNEQKIFLTNVLGQTVEYKDSENRKKIVDETIRYYSNINNNKNNN